MKMKEALRNKNELRTFCIIRIICKVLCRIDSKIVLLSIILYGNTIVSQGKYYIIALPVDFT